MAFTSLPFVLFVCVLCILYYVMPKNMQWGILLAAGICFYAGGGVMALAVLLTVCLLTYAGTMLLYRRQRQEQNSLALRTDMTREEKKAIRKAAKKKRWHLLVGVVLLLLGILFIFRYTDFVISNLNSLLPQNRQLHHIEWLVPMGISFYIFQAIAYVADVYNKKVEPERHFLKMALFLSFFPQLVQGPISRYADLSGELLKEHRFDRKNVFTGVLRILWGYAKKLVLADRAAIAVAAITGDVCQYDGMYAFCGILLYALQLYADFTGGIDIALGTARVLGISMTENFCRPYFSKNIAEYWRRWHITMGTWFRDYLFYPLSASLPMLRFSTFARKKWGQTIGKRLPVWISTLTVWAATGLWHGADWKYVMWGLCNGVILLLSQEFRPLYQRFHAHFPALEEKQGYRAFQVVRTVLLLSCLRMFDCYPDISSAVYAFVHMFAVTNIGAVFGGGLLRLGLTVGDYILLVIGAGVLFWVSLRSRRQQVAEVLFEKNIWVRYAVFAGLFFAILLFGAYGIGFDRADFIYNM